MIIYYVLIIIMAFISSTASFSLKKSTNGITVVSILTNKYLYIGSFLYIIAASLNIYILQKLPYSVVVPLGSITYIWTMLIAYFFLKEKIGINKIIGIILIISGVFCIAISS